MRRLLALLQSRLSTKFVLFTLLLLIIIQAAGFLIVRETVDRHVRAQSSESIAVSERIWEQFLTQVHDRLQEGAEVLSADFGFRSAVASRDEKTIASALVNSSERIGASVAILVNPQWELQASSSQHSMTSKSLDVLIHHLAESHSNNDNADLIAIYDGQPTQFVWAPVRAPRVVGHVLMGFTIQESRIQDASELADVDMALLTNDGNSIKVLASAQKFYDYFADHISPAYFSDRGQRELTIDDETYVTVTQGMEVIGGDISIVFMESLTQASARFNLLADQYLIITGAGVLIFGLLIIWLSNRVTHPLVALTKATSALEKGDFHADIGGFERHDEIGVLARSFDGMRTSISDQQAKIKQLAYYDPLTSLPNLINFRTQVQQAIESQQYDRVSIITINLDRFKQVNDVLGYEMGDNILKATASRITAIDCIEPDQVARVSGDEFSILVLPNCSSNMDVAKALQNALREPMEIDDTQIDLSSSIGIASWPDDVADCNNLINASQLAMYSAKARKEEIVEYREDLVTSAPENLGLLSELRRAVRQNELRVFLQPKVDTRSHEAVAAEALIRWEHPENGMVAPYRFVPFAEQTGFVRELTKWMIREIAKNWHALQPETGMLRISVNLSTRDLMTSGLPEFLHDVLEQYQVPASGMCLEITESAIMDDPKFAEQTLAKLSAMGFRLSIDDFGTGYSSLGYLKRLPVNELKVDQSFVFGMIENPNDLVIVQSTIDLAHNLGLDVVAEGVETVEMYEALSQLGCEEAQGYLISRPMPMEEFKAWRQDWSLKQASSDHPVFS